MKRPARMHLQAAARFPAVPMGRPARWLWLLALLGGLAMPAGATRAAGAASGALDAAGSTGIPHRDTAPAEAAGDVAAEASRAADPAAAGGGSDDGDARLAGSPGLLRIAAGRRALLDLGFAVLEPVSRPHHVPVRVEVLDPSPLLDLAGQHAEAGADIAMAEGELRVAQATVERLRRLRVQGENATLRELEAAELRAAAARATRARAESRLQLTEARARLDWGEAGRAWVSGGREGPLDAVMRAEARLLRVEAPPAAPPPLALPLASSGLPEATLLGPAPRLATPRLLRGWLYRLDDASLPLGHRIPGVPWPTGTVTRALAVPPAAVVWFGGQAWVWRQESGDSFRRLPIEPLPGFAGAAALLVRGPLAAGDRIVTRGAGQLLGEEFAGVIPSEEDD